MKFITSNGVYLLGGDDEMNGTIGVTREEGLCNTFRFKPKIIMKSGELVSIYCKFVVALGLSGRRYAATYIRSPVYH